MDKNTGRKKSKKKMLAKTKFCESLRVRNYERPTAYYYFDIWLMFLLSWKYSKQCDIGITCNSKGVLVIFLKLNSSDWMILRRYHSLNLKWFIRSIYLRPFLQNVYKEKPWCPASGLFLFTSLPNGAKPPWVMNSWFQDWWSGVRLEDGFRKNSFQRNHLIFALLFSYLQILFQ